MWERFKNKIIRFFQSDIEDQIDEDQNSHIRQYDQQQIQPRVLYQYPTKKTFRFPVIPDHEEYIQNKERHTKRSEEPLSLLTNQRNQSLDQNNNIEKPNKKRFVPSQVASPIYGYQQRSQSKKVENIPTFIRRDQASEQSNKLRENISIQTEDDRSLAKEENSETDKNSEIFLKDLIEEENQTLDEEIAYQETILEQEIIPTEQIICEENRHDQTGNHIEDENKENIHIKTEDQYNQEEALKEDTVSRRSRRHHRSTKKQTKQKPNQQSTGTTAFPFNVISSGIDYKSLRDKNKGLRPKKDEQYSVPFHLLDPPKRADGNDDQVWIQEQQLLLEKTLKHFNVEATVVNVTQGPSVTRFEVQPQIGVKVSKVKNLSDDIKLNMSAKDIRIEAPIPGKNTIGIEVPNKTPQMVCIQEIIKTEIFKQSESPLTVGLGLSVEGVPVVTDISKMPHGLIAGATGSGKSVCINTILISLLYKADPNEVKLLLIDPKMVELQPYNDLPHLVTPVITDVKSATAALKWAVNEMEERYEKFVDEGVRDIKRYNQKIQAENRSNEKMPYIVIVIDELADLMMVSPQDVEDAICRIAQKARACGMHLLLATQRPSVDVITGLIKANIPSRIAFSVSSQVDSRTIIDNVGAERLLGRGDMLFVENGSNKNSRIQGVFVSDDEIDLVTNYVKNLGKPNYLFEQDQLLKQIETNEEEDELLEACIEFVLEQNQASISLLQRQFRIGYNRAARIVDTLEAKGIISGQNGSKPREVLLSKSYVE